jgi:O-antigen biosynthesis protein
MFRMVAALESAGHECTVFLYDRYRGNMSDHESIIRQGWPFIRSRVVDVRDGITGMDGCIATSWQTAHVLARRGHARMQRFYFVQDFEPFFYPAGSEYALAEDSYRFGFRCIAIGRWVADVLREQIGISSAIVDFGCDTGVYQLERECQRDGVVFYAKPDTARRGFVLGLLALQDLHSRRPNVPIHLVGPPTLRPPFVATNHGACAPEDLARLYNQTRVGLALSFTNVSLVLEEMLACGTVVVANDSPYARAVVRSEYVHWAEPTPSGIADSLLSVLDAPPDPAKVASSACPDAWRPGQRAFLQAVEDVLYGS